MTKVAIRSTWVNDDTGALTASGVCSLGSREPWSMGRWRFDDRRLQFAAASTRGNVNLPLENIRRVVTSKRKFLIVSKPVLVVTYVPRAGSGMHHLWLLTGDLAPWEQRLTAIPATLPDPHSVDRMGRAITFAKALASVTGPTAQLLDLLASSGPATSATVAALLKLEERDAVMLSTSLSIGLAQIDQVLGGPALRYERSRFEPSTGIVHSMCWWLDNDVAVAWLSLRTSVEVYQDGDTVVVITSMPTRSSHTPPSVEVQEGGRGLLVSGAWDYSRYIELPAAVDDDVSVTVRSNGTLVVVGQCHSDQRPVKSSVPNGGSGCG